MSVGIFSGNPDPQWKVLSSQPNYKKISALLLSTKTYSTDAMPSRLGFKGFIVQEGKKAQLIVGPESKNLQLLLLASIPKGLLTDNVIKVIQDEISSGAVTADVSKVVAKRYAPPYNPGAWGGIHFRAKLCNNCYNYASTVVTNNFAKPGTGSGHPFGARTGPAVVAAAVWDGLVNMAPQPPPGPVTVPPAGNIHMMALVVWPGVDFHWYRLDSNNRWSHKPGSTDVTDRDNNRNMILDPRVADIGHYQFVTFMTVDRTTANIGGEASCFNMLLLHACPCLG